MACWNLHWPSCISKAACWFVVLNVFFFFPSFHTNFVSNKQDFVSLGNETIISALALSPTMKSLIRKQKIKFTMKVTCCRSRALQIWGLQPTFAEIWNFDNMEWRGNRQGERKQMEVWISHVNILILSAHIKSLNTWLFFAPVILLLGIYPKHVQKCLSPANSMPHSLAFNSNFF